MNALRWLAVLALAGLMSAAGFLHFVQPEPFVDIVPDYLPAPLMLVYVSGLAEIAGGLGVLFPATRRAAGLGLVLLLVCVFPANVYMALHQITPSGLPPIPTWAQWARLPLQAVLIAWAWAVSRMGRVAEA